MREKRQIMPPNPCSPLSWFVKRFAHAYVCSGSHPKSIRNILLTSTEGKRGVVQGKILARIESLWLARKRKKIEKKKLIVSSCIKFIQGVTDGCVCEHLNTYSGRKSGKQDFSEEVSRLLAWSSAWRLALH